MKRKHRRLTFVFLGFLLVATAAALVLTAFEDNIVFFHSPTDVVEKKLPPDRRMRIGGLVEEGSVEKNVGEGRVTFRITDLANTVKVTYRGLLPDLFREGQGVVAEGRLRDGIFHADEVLAKHDENYMPPEVADALKKSGKWKHLEEALGDAGPLKGETRK
ncbi:MAG TPA: cytochrome c maturation protein CcmE [Rhodospirillales bacterium]|nr:cytochrome c maturation protein CcmE [Rhodospirillales bacterium]